MSPGPGAARRAGFGLRAEGDDADRAPSRGGESTDSAFASGSGLAAGATASGPPIAVLAAAVLAAAAGSATVLSAGEAPAASSAPSAGTAGWSQSFMATGEVLSPAALPIPEAGQADPRAHPGGSRPRQAEGRGEGAPISPGRPARSRCRVRHDPSGGLPHPREKNIRGDPRTFPRGFLRVSVSRSDQDRRGPEANPHRNIAHFITDHEAGARIRHPEPPKDLLGEPRPRLPASARSPIRFHGHLPGGEGNTRPRRTRPPPPRTRKRTAVGRLPSPPR